MRATIFYLGLLSKPVGSLSPPNLSGLIPSCIAHSPRFSIDLVPLPRWMLLLQPLLTANPDIKTHPIPESQRPGLPL